jgi:glycosyltransferase involved in cell wall biosynthesis
MKTEILYVVNSSLASATGGGRTRVIAAAKHSRKAGFSVRIVCFFRPQLRFGLLSAGRAALQSESGCEAHLIPRLPLTRISWVGRLNDLYCGLMVALLCWRYGVEVIHGHGMRTVIFALEARRLKRNLKVVADVHGAAAEEYLYARELARHDRTAMDLEKQEEVMLRMSDWLIFVSRAMLEFYEKKSGLRFRNYSVIPCVAESDFETNNDRRGALREEFGLTGKLVFCYVGDCESYQLPDVMCRMFEETRQLFPDSFFLIFSHHRKKFIEHLEKARVPPANYRVIAVEHSRIFDLLQMADIGLMLRDDSVVNRVASPVKFGEYLQCGVPVISSDSVGDASRLIADHKLGAIIAASELSKPLLNSGVKRFIADALEKRVEYSERCATFVRTHYRWDAYCQELGKIYSSPHNGGET